MGLGLGQQADGRKRRKTGQKGLRRMAIGLAAKMPPLSLTSLELLLGAEDGAESFQGAGSCTLTL